MSVNFLFLAFCWVAIAARFTSVFFGRYCNGVWAPLVIFGGAIAISLFGRISSVKRRSSVGKNIVRDESAEKLGRIIKTQLSEYEKRYRHLH